MKLTKRDGKEKVILSAPDGSDLSVTDGKLDVNAEVVIGDVDIDVEGLATEITLADIKAAVEGTLTVDTGLNQPLTDAQLRIADVKITMDGEQVGVSNFPEIQEVSVSSLPLPTGAATSAGQTDGSQKTQIVDAGGEQVTVTGGKLDVNASVDTTGLATEAKQDDEIALLTTIDADTSNLDVALSTRLKPADTLAGITALGSITNALPTGANSIGQVTANAGTNLNTSALALEATLSSLNGKVTAVDTGDVTVSSSALPTGAATSALQTTGNSSLSSIDGKITAVNTGAVVISSSALPTGAATSALQGTGNTSLATIAGAVSGTEMQVDVLTMPTTTVQATNLDIRDLTFAADKVDASGSTLGANSGTDIGDVTINNASGAAAVNIQDGGNTITVDGTVAATQSGTWSSRTQDGSGNAITSTSSALDVNIKGNVANMGTLSTNNSSTATLNAGVAFTGTGEEVLAYNEIRVSVIASHASATDGLSLQQSSDNSNWDIIDTYTIPATTGKTFVVPRQARYFRIVYTNGGVNQSSFRLQTILNRSGNAQSSQRPSDTYSNETDMEQVWAFNSMWNGSTWDRMRSGSGTSTSALRVTEAKPANAYCYMIPSQVHVAGANTVHWDMFNADATLIVRVVSIRQIPNITTAVTGIVFDWLLERTTAVGTGGSTLTAWLPDTSDTALDADITARSKPTGGATQSTDLFNYSLSSEETNAATIQIASQGGLELIPPHLLPISGGKGVVLRQNQGIRCVQVTNSNAGNTAWLISFVVE